MSLLSVPFSFIIISWAYMAIASDNLRTIQVYYLMVVLVLYFAVFIFFSIEFVSENFCSMIFNSWLFPPWFLMKPVTPSFIFLTTKLILEQANIAIIGVHITCLKLSKKTKSFFTGVTCQLTASMTVNHDLRAIALSLNVYH